MVTYTENLHSGRGKRTQATVSIRSSWREDEGGLRLIELSRDSPQQTLRKIPASFDDRERIAGEWFDGEYVDKMKREGAGRGGHREKKVCASSMHPASNRV